MSARRHADDRTVGAPDPYNVARDEALAAIARETGHLSLGQVIAIGRALDTFIETNSLRCVGYCSWRDG